MTLATSPRRSWHQTVRRSPKADRTSAEGFVFDSKAELRRWEELKLLERAGKIFGLQRQMEYPLVVNGSAVKIRSRGFPNGRPCVYTLDFSYVDVVTRQTVREEFKGHDDSESRLRRAVVEAMYDIEIIVTGPAANKTPRR